MFQSRRSKIVLVVIVVIIIIVALVLYANSKATPIEQIAATPTPGALSTPRYTGELPAGQTVTSVAKVTATPRPLGPVGSTVTPIAVVGSTKVAIVQKAVTPTPVSNKPVIIGDLDWSKNQTPVSSIQLDPATQAAFEKIKENPDICALTGISDSWSNPFEKTVCGMVRFINDQVIVPLIEFDCQAYGAYLSTNYSSSIKTSIVNGDCQIEDRS